VLKKRKKSLTSGLGVVRIITKSTQGGEGKMKKAIIYKNLDMGQEHQWNKLVEDRIHFFENRCLKKAQTTVDNYSKIGYTTNKGSSKITKLSGQVYALTNE